MKHQKYKVANHEDGCRSDWPILQKFCISHCNGLLLDKLISFVLFRLIYYLLYVFCYRRLVQDSWNSFWLSFITKNFLRSQVCSSLQRFSSEEVETVANIWWTPNPAFPSGFASRQSLNSQKDRLAEKKASGIRQHIRSNCSFAAFFVLCILEWLPSVFPFLV